MKIAIIGAGAAGVMAAITAKRLNKNLQIDIFDINKSIGKKILASGNGRCNISNTQISDKNYIGENPSFVNQALKEFDFKAFENFCKSIGLLLDIKENCKVYPLSNEAKSVVSLLENSLETLKINLILETKIINIEKQEEKFILNSEDKKFKFYDKVLISSGLMAAPQLNATEDGLALASSFAHSFNPTYPSLVGLHTEFKYKEKLQGVKKEATITLYIDKQKEVEITADLLFTSYGVSGFAILDISQYAVYALNLYQNVEISINFFPQLSKNELLGILETLFKSLEDSFAVTLLTGIVSKKLAKVLLEIANLPSDILAKELNSKHIRTLVNTLTNLRMKVIDTQGFKHAEASGGGIRTAEVDNKTYESKLCKNLYFAGEVLDIVGNRGGFNLHFAWASGYLAGKALSK
ncbi:aminoacetone oxidase family FAD-binding enzyme [Malaciobacter mytili]|uniref:Aminoacetone oxidase family FAD-binding enzyme n=1 Tax=Malaciobacter mytili LMG 24559 TaxID=1032238 RepID=A0AAX2AEL4_9BACT|nr:NAD(P)/FAD-dependent oxidoreductase [Malaciobacter mytili]AXH16259.1 flavoprotein, HI0933 family [Malaciobacter mytili LMG 24559]RXI42389.1 aminoacetone oxidase family FAD-binding enzyme [Malaciobacter mytili]RXK13772.1 aminoacetone oxidase family FAD-binding enzyme [Malaciobacter mytili LMG 24559]